MNAISKLMVEEIKAVVERKPELLEKSYYIKGSKKIPYTDVNYENYIKTIIHRNTSKYSSSYSEYDQDVLFYDVLNYIMGYGYSHKGFLCTWEKGNDPLFPLFSSVIHNTTKCCFKKFGSMFGKINTTGNLSDSVVVSLDSFVDTNYIENNLGSNNNIAEYFKSHELSEYLEVVQYLLKDNKVQSEILKLFLNGVSKKDITNHIQKFGINGKGGTHSVDKQMIVKPVSEDGKTLNKKSMENSTKPFIHIKIEPKYASFSSQIFHYYAKKLKSFLHSFWNEFTNPHKKIDQENQVGTQFLNWEATYQNKY